MNLQLMNLAEAKKNELTRLFPDDWLEDSPCNYVEGYLDVLLELVEDFYNGCELNPKDYMPSLRNFLDTMETYNSDYEFYPSSNDRRITDYIRTLI